MQAIWVAYICHHFPSKFILQIRFGWDLSNMSRWYKLSSSERIDSLVREIGISKFKILKYLLDLEKKILWYISACLERKCWPVWDVVVVVVLLLNVHGQQLWSWRDGQLTWAGLHLLSSQPVLSAHSFASNWQLPFLNQRKGENDCKKDFMINLNERRYAFRHENFCWPQNNCPAHLHLIS